ncbi:hypothetical protein [Longimicrobium sp.]|uniref:hypothetical protein n=1 Tax=Longimicrobium sp. TaxID=2029185 RepID=UPI002CD1E185|nr:hypothetical protein [Longimicrobium sp.]HSU13338.1 hypothetical protein [Longimicrobium sp.]
MPRIRTLLLPAALLCAGWTASAHAQVRAPRPHKRIEVVSQGMTPAQVRAVLGEPLRTRREGTLTYLYYANGSAAAGGDDYVVVQDCRVVGAHFANPSRFVARAPADTGTPPAAECHASAADSASAPPAMAMRADTPRTPAPPTDVNPGGAMPAQQPRLVAEDRPLPQLGAGEWRSKLTLRHPGTHLLAVPAASISSPTGFGVDMGEAFVGVAYQERTRFTTSDDATASIGMGFGDRDRLVGLEVSATSYSTLRGGGPFETGGLNFKLHHAFGDVWGVAVGYENAVRWGGSDAGQSPYATVTRVFRLNDDSSRPFSAIAATLGAGAGRFRSESDVAADRKTVNPFGAIGIQVIEPLSLTADWNGQDLYAAASIAPIRRVPLVINAGVADITGSAGDGARFILSAGLGFRWLPPFF